MQNANVHKYIRVYIALYLEDSNFFYFFMGLFLHLKNKPFSFHLFCFTTPFSLSVCLKDMM